MTYTDFKSSTKILGFFWIFFVFFGVRTSTRIFLSEQPPASLVVTYTDWWRVKCFKPFQVDVNATDFFALRRSGIRQLKEYRNLQKYE